MKSSLFDAVSALRKIEVKIDGNVIPNEDFVEIELHWEHNSFEVQGAMVLKDNRDLNAFFTNWDRKIVNLYFTDLDGEDFSRDFYIVKMSESKGQEANDKMFEISMVDKLSFELKNTYYSKSYSGKTFSQIIDNIWGIFNFDSLYDKKYVEKQFSKTIQVHDGIVVPQDRSLYEFFEYQLNQEGYIWFQQRDAICIRGIQEILPSSLTIDKSKDFTEDVENPNYGFKILEFSGNYMNFFESLKLPSSTTYFYDYDEKIMKTVGNNLEDAYDNLKSANIDEKYIQPTKGKRFSLKEKSLNCDKILLDTYWHFMKNVEIEIFVPGNSKKNKLYEKRNAFFKGSSLHQEGHSEGNTKLQGEFLVFSIYDKILGDKMISKVNVCRLNNTVSFGAAGAAITESVPVTPVIVPTPVPEVPPVPQVEVPSGAQLAQAAVPEVPSGAITGSTVASSLTNTASSVTAAATNSSLMASVSSVASNALSASGGMLTAANTLVSGAINTLASGGTINPTALLGSLTPQLSGAVSSFGTAALGSLSGMAAQVGAFAGDVIRLPDMNSVITSMVSGNFDLSSINPSSLVDLGALQNNIVGAIPGVITTGAQLGTIYGSMALNSAGLEGLSNSLVEVATGINGLSSEEATNVLDNVSPEVSSAIMLTENVVPVSTIAVDTAKLEAAQAAQVLAQGF